MGRAPCCDKANVKRGSWSPEEDAKLKSYLDKHGTGGNWIALPQKIGLKRCGKSCRLRWLNYLRPNIKHGGFTEDEDNLICSLYTTIGSRWSVIAAQLPGRTDNGIKNYWNTRLRKKLLDKQRKQQERRDHCSSNKQLEIIKGYQNYSTNPQPPQPAPPPLLARYANDQDILINPVHEPASNSLTYILTMPHIQEKFPYHDFETDFQPGYDETDFQPGYDVSCAQNHPPLLSDFGSVNGAAAANFTAFDNNIVPEEIVPQQLDGLGNSPDVTMVNFVSQEINTSWEDHIISSIFQPSSALTSYDVCHQKMPQDWTSFDEPRLLGYS